MCSVLPLLEGGITPSHYWRRYARSSPGLINYHHRWRFAAPIYHFPPADGTDQGHLGIHVGDFDFPRLRIAFPECRAYRRLQPSDFAKPNWSRIERIELKLLASGLAGGRVTKR